jgi:hypothetical protein
MTYEEWRIRADPASLAIWTTMRERVDHALQIGLLSLPPEAGDAAHA